MHGRLKSATLESCDKSPLALSCCCAGLKFRETPPDYDYDFHTAPARQFIVNLDAAVDIEVSDGSRRVFPAGSVIHVEDTWGRVSSRMHNRSLDVALKTFLGLHPLGNGSFCCVCGAALAPQH